jgi:superfamily II DNA or RNA helicase
MTPILRDYQSDTVDCVFREWEQCVSTLVVIPTGGGKSAIAAEIIRRIQPARAMFLVHREELVWQFRNTLEKFVGLDAGIEMAELHTNTDSNLFGNSPVVIATVQTLNSNWNGRTRMGRFNPSDFGVLVVDEGHHGVAKSYRNVLNYFGQNPKLKMLFLSATPDRSDQEALGQVVQTVAKDIEILDLVHTGWLLKPMQQFVHAMVDLSAVRTTAGDLNGADLAAVMEAEQSLQGVAGATLQIIDDKRTIVFTASVKQAEMLSNIFNRHRPGMSSWVCGKTNKDVRRQMLADFAEGKFQVICNCGVLTEGFDDCGVAVIVMARPTKSRSLYAQMAGRALRPLAGVVDGLDTPEARLEAIARSAKPCAELLDFVGNSGKHKLMTSADILGGKVSEDAVAMAVKIAQSKGGPVDMAELLDESEERVQEEARERRLQEEARKARLVANVKFSSKIVNPFDAWDLDPVRERGWDNGRALSEKQRHLLMKQGIDPDTMHYSAAKAVLSEMFRRWDKHLCTLKQAALLKKHGFDPKDMTVDQAKNVIDKIAANGWNRPANLEQPVSVPKLGEFNGHEEQSPF